MIKKVIKRDGKIVDFNVHKIIDAINKAFNETKEFDNEYCYQIAYNIASDIHDLNTEEISVEEIQDIIEDWLHDYEAKKTAKAYTRYRYDREKVRESKKELFDAMSDKLMARNIENQNANVDELSFGGRKGEADSIVMKDWALNHCMSKMARDNHLNNEIYTHDLDSYALGCHNCLTIPFDDLLARGFNTRQVDIRPANSINTAFQLVAVIFQLQSLQQFGGCSASHLDWTMVPYVRKSFYKHYINGMKYLEGFDGDALEDLTLNDKMPIDDIIYKTEEKTYKYAMEMTEKELKQSVEGLYHNLNSLQSRSGNQLPFTSINYGTCTLTEGRMVTKAILDGSLNGVGKHHRTPVFPCGIFQCMKGVNRKPGEPNYDLFKLALKSTSLRLYPNYANVDWSVNAGYDVNDPRTYVSTMGCRTYNGFDINGFGQLKDGRGNIAPVTIIMPTLAMESYKWFITNEHGLDERDLIIDFMNRLDKKIHEAKDILIERFEFICSQPMESARFMYENNVMYGYVQEEGIRSALKHGTLAIGNLGLAETLQILIGKDHTTKEGMELAKRIYQLFNKRCKEFKEEYKLNFGVYNTPAENLCYTSMKKFKDKYGVIPNVSDKEFFTNSIHVPVWKEITAFEKIDIESELTGYSNAGCITYVELEGSIKNNLDALETIVNYAMDKDIPYFAVNVPNDTCLDCGYMDEFNNNCPKCGSENIQQLRRVTGYLTGDYKTAFNKGKIQETELRVRHGENCKY